jgi:hypothetical protein
MEPGLCFVRDRIADCATVAVELEFQPGGVTPRFSATVMWLDDSERYVSFDVSHPEAEAVAQPLAPRPSPTLSRRRLERGQPVEARM